MVDPEFSEDIAVVGAINVVPSILDVVCQSTGMRFAAIARVTEDRWVACGVRDEIAFGLEPGGELDVGSTICNEIRDHREAVIIDDVDNDPLYCRHHTPKTYGLKSYISVPIILSDDSFFGTLCAISPKPAKVSEPKIVGMFNIFAGLIAHHIEAGRSVEQSTIALLNEQETSALREQFIAVLGHDLRNPLAGIESGMRLLGKEQLSDRGRSIIGLINGSVGRMAGLIDNVMDFARGRLGGGITLTRTPANIAVTLNQVISEFETSHPDRTILKDMPAEIDVFGDHARLGQVFSNLIGNALMHGDPAQPISIALRKDSETLVFQTTNMGETIPPVAMGKLFQPFSRGDVRSSLQGLGLGLYICAQVAAAHGASLDVTSEDGETTFTFTMPLADDHPASMDA